MNTKLKTSLETVLSDADLAKLRKGYVAQEMCDAARRAFAFHPPAMVFADLIVTEHYEKGFLSGKDRERCLIALLASEGTDFTLAVHLYWGLMEGLSPADIAATLLLVGTYQGFDCFAKSGKFMMRTLNALKTLSEKVSGPVSPQLALTHLMENFGGAET